MINQEIIDWGKEIGIHPSFWDDENVIFALTDQRDATATVVAIGYLGFRIRPHEVVELKALVEKHYPFSPNPPVEEQKTPKKSRKANASLQQIRFTEISIENIENSQEFNTIIHKLKEIERDLDKYLGMLNPNAVALIAIAVSRNANLPRTNQLLQMSQMAKSILSPLQYAVEGITKKV